MIRVKICGIGNPDDACVAAEAGADYIGMVFVPERRRRITPDDAKDIVDGVRALDGLLRQAQDRPLRQAHPSTSSGQAPSAGSGQAPSTGSGQAPSAGSGQASPRMVGLFADQPLQEVNDVIAHCGLDAVQLCGRESVEYAAGVNCEIIKVVHVPASWRAPDDVPQLAGRVREYADSGCLVTLDRLVEGIQGGTGQSFDLDVAASLSSRGASFLLAGGLTPANVGRAISIVRPWGVDVSSGVETIGKKDRRKIRRFIENARHADAALTGSA